jgi:hypothetical protein
MPAPAGRNICSSGREPTVIEQAVYVLAIFFAKHVALFLNIAQRGKNGDKTITIITQQKIKNVRKN